MQSIDHAEQYDGVCSPEDVVKSLLFPSINCSHHSIITLYSCKSIFLCIQVLLSWLF